MGSLVARTAGYGVGGIGDEWSAQRNSGLHHRGICPHLYGYRCGKSVPNVYPLRLVYAEAIQKMMDHAAPGKGAC